jgi:peptidoglycan/xylan/chitin deacetylase (PgdA/CDA1 family)
MPMNFVTTTLDRIYNTAQHRYPGVLFYGNHSRYEIALTFDDGPHPRDTRHVLDVLEKYHVRATFFVVGKDIEGHASLVKQIHDSGHQLGIHCYRHIPFPLENPSMLRKQLERTRNTIAELCGISPERLQDLRPPYGAFNVKTLKHLSEWGYRLVLWSSIPPHWMQPISWSIRQVMESIVPGAVIVLHDGHGHGTRVAEIVENIVPRVQSLGYKFVTVEEMQNQRG